MKKTVPSCPFLTQPAAGPETEGFFSVAWGCRQADLSKGESSLWESNHVTLFVLLLILGPLLSPFTINTEAILFSERPFNNCLELYM